MKARVILLGLSIATAPFAYSASAEPVAEPKGYSIESRHLLQAVLPTRTQARSVVDAIQAGESFATAAGRVGLSPADIEVGQITESDFANITSSDLAREVFNGPLEIVVGPYQTDLGWHVVEAISGPVRRDAIRTKGASRPATDWWFINLSSGPNSRALFADKSSIQRSSDAVLMWTFSVYKSAGPKGRQSSKSYMGYDCNRRTAAVLSIADYRKDGSVIGSRDFSPDPTPVPPDTILSDELRFACGDTVASAFQLTKWRRTNGLLTTPENMARELLSSK